MISEKPMIAFNGVRNSWLILARSLLFARSAACASNIAARATSACGVVQPLDRDPLNGGYRIHHSRPTRVRVTSARRLAQPADAATLVWDMNAYAEEDYRLPLDVELEFSAGEGI